MISPRNPLYRQALASSHNAYSRVEVWRSGIQVEELAFTGVPTSSSLSNVVKGAPVFLGGSVRATLASRVARTMTMVVPDWLYPWSNTDLLAPWGNELRVFRGIQYGTGEVDEFQVFRGPVTSARPAGGTVNVNASDQASIVVGSSFPAPSLANVGSLITTEVKRLISGAISDATFGAFDNITNVVPALSYDYDRGAALDGLAAVAGAVWYPLANGNFVLRYVPWAVPITTSGITLTNIGGTLLSAFPARDRSNVYNRVTVSNEPVDGSAPIYATVDDLDTDSPTYILGPFGVKAIQLRVTQAVNQDGCRQTASSALAKFKALTQAWSITCVPDASIELGDPLNVAFLDTSNVLRKAVQLVAGFTLPLDTQAAMTIDGRDPIATDQL